MTAMLSLLVSVAIYALWFWFIRNPRKLNDVSRARVFRYVLYGSLGFSIGIVAIGLLAAYLVTNNPAYDMKGMQFFMPGSALMGTLLGLLSAYLHPAALTISPRTEENLDRLAQAQEDAKKLPRGKVALFQGLILTTINGLLLLLNYFFGIFNNIQDQNTGAQTPVWFMYALCGLGFVAGVYEILYFLFVKARHAFAPQQSETQGEDSDQIG